MAQLTTTYAGLTLQNPIIISSSGLTNSAAKIKELEKSGAGAVVLKSVFEEQINMQAGNMQGYGSPEADDYLGAYVRSHALNEHIALIQEAKKSCSIPIIASINCYSDNEWVDFAGDEHETQQHVLRTLAEWRNQGLRHHHVESALGSGYGEYETAQEEDDGRVGEARHHTLIVEQLAHLSLRALHDLKGGVADEEQQHEDDHYAGCPCRYGLGEPEHHGHDEDGDDALLHDGESIDAEAVDGQVPDDSGKFVKI